jgi:tetratricopeptide (TPR) repeat protein
VSVPAEIPGLGSSAQKVRPNPAFDAMSAGIGPEDYFVWSRIDGALSLREVLLMTGLPIERAIEAVRKLRELGAILLPGETSVTVPRPGSSPRNASPYGRAPSSSGAPSGPASSSGSGAASTSGRLPTAGGAGQTSPPSTGRLTGRVRTEASDLAAAQPPELELHLDDPTPEERRMLDEAGDLSDADRRRVLAMLRLIAAGDPYALLGLPPGADKRQVKRAYFTLSKDFHPDRYYGRRLGAFGPRLERIFETLSRAYTELTEPKGARESARPARQTGEAQSPTEYAAELFERACQTEVHGDPLEAMKQFAAAIRLDPQVRYLRRAARCALTAGQPRSAEEYANKAANLEPSDPSIARLLAAAFRAQNKLDAAEEVLIMALAVPAENDLIVVELRKDLAEIRRALSAAGSSG